MSFSVMYDLSDKAKIFSTVFDNHAIMRPFTKFMNL